MMIHLGQITRSNVLKAQSSEYIYPVDTFTNQLSVQADKHSKIYQGGKVIRKT